MHNKTISYNAEKYVNKLNEKITIITNAYNKMLELESHTNDYCLVILDQKYADNLGLVLLRRPTQTVFNFEFEYLLDDVLKTALCLVFDMHDVTNNERINAAVNCFIEEKHNVICIKDGTVQGYEDTIRHDGFSLDYVVSTLRGCGYRKAKITTRLDGMPSLYIVPPCGNCNVMSIAIPALVDNFKNKHVKIVQKIV